MKRAFSLNQKVFFITFKLFLLQKYVTTENPSFKVNDFCSSFKVTIFEKMVLIQKLLLKNNFYFKSHQKIINHVDHNLSLNLFKLGLLGLLTGRG